MILLLLSCASPPGQAELDLDLPTLCRESLAPRDWSTADLSQLPTQLSLTVSWDQDMAPDSNDSGLTLALRADLEQQVVQIESLALQANAACPPRTLWPVLATLRMKTELESIEVSLRGSQDSLGALRLDGDTTAWQELTSDSMRADIWVLRMDTAGGQLRVATRVGLQELERLWAGELER